MRQVLFLCNDVIGEQMAGPAIRYWELARAVDEAGCEVTLAVLPFVPAASVPVHVPFTRFLHCADDDEVLSLAKESDVVVTHGALLASFSGLASLGVPLALDMYIPFLLERLHVDTDTDGAEHLFVHEDYRRALQQQVLAADFVFCASEKQRDYWLGALSAGGRVNPYTHAQDPTLRRLIDVVPFGLPAQPPHHTRRVLKGVHPGIELEDKVLLWGGGIWNWFDAPTLLRAMREISLIRQDVKLFFMGTRRPGHVNPRMLATAEAIELGGALGLTGKTVFFNDWVPYKDRANYLLEADIGTSLHRDHLETRFSFRTRFLDYLWAGLPIITTRGDVLSDQVERERLGRVVDSGDVQGLADAILQMVDTPGLRDSYQSRFRQVAASYRWDVVARPLIGFCREPSIAPDKSVVRAPEAFDVGPTPPWSLPAKAWRAWQLGGSKGLKRQIDSYRRWLFSRRGK